MKAMLFPDVADDVESRTILLTAARRARALLRGDSVCTPDYARALLSAIERGLIILADDEEYESGEFGNLRTLRTGRGVRVYLA